MSPGEAEEMVADWSLKDLHAALADRPAAPTLDELRLACRDGSLEGHKVRGAWRVPDAAARAFLAMASLTPEVAPEEPAASIAKGEALPLLDALGREARNAAARGAIHRLMGAMRGESAPTTASGSEGVDFAVPFEPFHEEIDVSDLGFDFDLETELEVAIEGATSAPILDARDADRAFEALAALRTLRDDLALTAHAGADAPAPPAVERRALLRRSLFRRSEVGATRVADLPGRLSAWTRARRAEGEGEGEADVAAATFELLTQIAEGAAERGREAVGPEPCRETLEAIRSEILDGAVDPVGTAVVEEIVEPSVEAETASAPEIETPVRVDEDETLVAVEDVKAPNEVEPVIEVEAAIESESTLDDEVEILDPNAPRVIDELDEEGRLVARITVAPGAEGEEMIPEGPYSSFHLDGSLAASGHYVAGRLEGGWRQWHENGEVAVIGSHREGRAQGRWVFRHRNGQKAREGHFDAGQPVGLWRSWDSRGRLLSETEMAAPAAV
ncbi:MAG: hypothetical protein R3F20_14930 [Planctomycetota bacterium]